MFHVLLKMLGGMLERRIFYMQWFGLLAGGFYVPTSKYPLLQHLFTYYQFILVKLEIDDEFAFTKPIKDVLLSYTKCFVKCRDQRIVLQSFLIERSLNMPCQDPPILGLDEIGSYDI